jgi:SAM-dependent methyltransferase/uncharacterized coiled-coil DUF342 family protein
MTTQAADGSLGAWLRRLPTYLYLIDLLPGKRVLEVGCGIGYGAQFLADHGAARVVGVDRSQQSISDARARYRQTNLEFRCEEPGSIELDDASFDCIFVPDGIDVLRRISVLGELRRLLARDGTLVVCGPSADRRGSPGGASFYEFRERLERSFAPVRMVAQSPFVGFSLVEYASGAGDEQVVETQLDTSLLELTGAEPEPIDYVAVCGGGPGLARGYTLVQVPEREGIEAAAAALGLGAAETRAEPAAEEQGQAWGRPGTSPGEGGRDALLVHELRLRLETAIADRATAQAQMAELRATAEELRAREQALRADTDELRARRDELGAEAEELRQRLSETAEQMEARQGGPSASEQIAAALSAHRDAVRSLENAVEEGEAYAEELRTELEQAAGQAATQAAGRSRAEARAERLEAELREWRTRASTAEGKLLRLARGADGQEVAAAPAARVSAPAVVAPVASVAPVVPAPPVVEEGGRVAELEEELSRARQSWREAEAQLESLRSEWAAKREARDGNGEAGQVAPAAGAVPATVSRDVARNLARFELELESGRALIQQVESGLAELEHHVARDASDRAPSAWAAHRDQQLRELSAELGIKDAEIMILHIGVSALRARMRELIGDIHRTAGQARQRPLPEVIALVEQLGERASAFEERDEPAGA